MYIQQLNCIISKTKKHLSCYMILGNINGQRRFWVAKAEAMVKISFWSKNKQKTKQQQQKQKRRRRRRRGRRRRRRRRTTTSKTTRTHNFNITRRQEPLNFKSLLSTKLNIKIQQALSGAPATKLMGTKNSSGEITLKERRRERMADQNVS